jgi:hypothetical protein
MKYAFNQNEITNWLRFVNIANQLGYTVRVTGGMVDTHEINGNETDFRAIQSMSEQSTPKIDL